MLVARLSKIGHSHIDPTITAAIVAVANQAGPFSRETMFAVLALQLGELGAVLVVGCAAHDDAGGAVAANPKTAKRLNSFIIIGMS